MVVVAVATVPSAAPPQDPTIAPRARQAADILPGIPVVAQRPSRPDYRRAAFGAAWTDAVAVAGGANGCDTRNDILARDLTDTRTAAVASCPRAVTAGEFRSPYTGEFVVFRRGGRAGSVQIDHIVPLAFAWDMGAWAWTPTKRMDLANDPANLVAVDASSNLAKSDLEPGRWMPPNRGFHCHYAIQFVAVVATYGLELDDHSRQVLSRTLRRCAS
ncbi:HNH endonuclease family protein [Gordonia rhizosphera]|uniref:GmrSD restriction endonucleases C-terminal domain-containing protein n=1 Tax=Gordonia rhizosphera NBRC 16068 TaxID=1108045 RepID=K6W9Z3_9ACTN|nr:hypothetical protein GORHZ_107_00260 [Gordonia rhizosphera NBRC 16068]